MGLQLKEKLVVITGPAKGMGAAVSLAFANEGAHLALAGRDIAAIEPVAAKARAGGAEIVIFGPGDDRPGHAANEAIEEAQLIEACAIRRGLAEPIVGMGR